MLTPYYSREVRVAYRHITTNLNNNILSRFQTLTSVGVDFQDSFTLLDDTDIDDLGEITT